MRFVLKLVGVLFGLVVAAGIAVAFYAFTLLPNLPSIDSLKDVPLKVPLRVYTAEGSLMAEFGEERREPVMIEQVPETLIQAI